MSIARGRSITTSAQRLPGCHELFFVCKEAATSYYIYILMRAWDWFRNLFEHSEPAAVPPKQQDDFFHGANLPWIRYGCDFGTNEWHPRGGMAQEERRDELRNSFRTLAGADVRVVRWFMLCDGRAGLRFDHNNISLDASFFPDVDAALQIAEEFGIRIMFVLFDFHWFHRARVVEGVQLGGRGRFFTKSLLRRRILENVLRPIFARYAKHPAIHSWDIFNEPDWILRGIGAWKPAGSCSLKTFRTFVDDVARMIHQETIHPATLGLARRSSLQHFRDCALDLYQVHWYDGHFEEVGTPLDFHAPVILGEFPTAGSRLSVAQILQDARDAGFAGALAWSVRDTVNLSSLPSFLDGLQEFRAVATEAVTTNEASS